MRWRAWLPGALAFVVAIGFAESFAQRASADAFTYTEDFSKFGTTLNGSCGLNGACGAVASMNSFTFLGKQYPGIYGNMLTPNMAMDGTDTVDANKFATGGWQVGSNPARKGYYDPARPHNADYTDSFLQTKKDWINDFAPGTTVFDSWFAGSADHDRKPTIADLAQEMKDKEDVEFFIRGTSGTTDVYHVLTLTEVSCDMANSCSIRYQDPNAPTVNQPSTPITVNMGMLQFMNIPGYPGTYTITAAFAESPKNVPEPATIVMLATAGIGLALYRRRS